MRIDVRGFRVSRFMYLWRYCRFLCYKICTFLSLKNIHIPCTVYWSNIFVRKSIWPFKPFSEVYIICLDAHIIVEKFGREHISFSIYLCILVFIYHMPKRWCWTRQLKYALHVCIMIFWVIKVCVLRLYVYVIILKLIY